LIPRDDGCGSEETQEAPVAYGIAVDKVLDHLVPSLTEDLGLLQNYGVLSTRRAGSVEVVHQKYAH
jgi:hypothetical protein